MGERSRPGWMSVRRLRKKSLLRDGIIVLGVTPIKIVGALALVSIAENLYGAAFLAAFLLYRRLISTLPNGLAAGVSNALQRYVPLHGDDSKINLTVLYVGLIPAAFLGTLTWGGVILWPRPIASALLGATVAPSAHSAVLHLVVLTSLLFVLHYAASGLLLGKRRVFMAQLLDLSVVTFAPLVALWIIPEPGDIVVYARVFLGLAATVVVPTFLVLAVRERRRFTRASREHARPDPPPRRELIPFGLSRAGAAFLDSSLLAVPLILVAQDAVAVAILGVAIVLVRLVSAGIAPVSTVVGVRLAQLVGSARIADGQALLGQSWYWAGALGVVGTIALSPNIGVLLPYWVNLSSSNTELRNVVLVVMAGLPPAALFHSAKSLADARHFVPINLIALIAANATLVVSYLLLEGMPLAYRTAVALTVASWVLAGTQWAFLRGDLRAGVPTGSGRRLLRAAAVTGCLAFGAGLFDASLVGALVFTIAAGSMGALILMDGFRVFFDHA